MSIYNYKCEDCGNLFQEVISAKHKSDTVVVCSLCKSNNTKKLIPEQSVNVNGPSRGGCSSCGSCCGF